MAPASRGGAKLSSARLAARVCKDKSIRFDFRRTATNAISKARTDSATQTENCARAGWPIETIPATMALTPMTTPPQPGTAVNEAARSIVSRMKRRLAAARRSMGTVWLTAPARCANAIRTEYSVPAEFKSSAGQARSQGGLICPDEDYVADSGQSFLAPDLIVAPSPL